MKEAPESAGFQETERAAKLPGTILYNLKIGFIKSGDPKNLFEGKEQALCQ